MINFLKKNILFLLIFAISGLIGGLLVGDGLLAGYPDEVVNEILNQLGDASMLAVLTGVQYAIYGFSLGAFGIFLAERIGLWSGRPGLKAKPFAFSLLVGAFGGLAMIGSDVLWFGKQVPAILEYYIEKPSYMTVAGYMILGGVVEEVMLRLFAMSLIAFVLIKIFKNCEKTDIFFVIANVFSTILFAAGHLPLTQILFGLTPIIVFRCFLLNGGFGLLFGRLYRKHGIIYAMIAHAVCHLVSKAIWIAFL